MRSKNNERRRAEQAAKWAALPPEEQQRRKIEFMDDAKILAEAGRRAMLNCSNCIYEFTPELCPLF